MKKLLLITLLLMVSPFARTQFSSVMAEDPNYPRDAITIVRNLSNSEVITYVHDLGIHRFTYENNSSLFYNYIDLPSPYFDKIVVNDFRIVGEMLYFCGKNLALNCGVLGVIKATPLRGPLPINAQIDYFDVAGTTVLFIMDAYIDPATNTPRVAAVGYDRVSSCGMWACGVWVDCAGFMPSVTPSSLSVFNSYYAGPGNYEHWSDVVSTNEWVVLVGAGYYGGQEGLMLRRFHKGNLADPELDNLYFYPESESLIWEELRAVALNEDDIAVVFRGIRNNNVTDFTKFRVFDIGLMQNINSQEYVIPYKSLINEMAYMKGADRVVLVNDFPSPNYISNFVYLIPYQTTAYNTVYVHDQDWRFWSVTNLDGNFFVGSGCFHFLLRDASASYPAVNDYSGIPPLCPENEELMVSIIENDNKNMIFEPIVFMPPPITIIRSTIPVLKSILSIRCFSK